MSALWCCMPVPSKAQVGEKENLILIKKKIFKASRAINCSGYMLISFTES